MENLEEEIRTEDLIELAHHVETLMKSELDNENREYDRLEAKIFKVKNVGVQGDQRTYAYPTEIAIYSNGELIYDHELWGKISTRITNEIKDINRVSVLIKEKRKSLPKCIKYPLLYFTSLFKK